MKVNPLAPPILQGGAEQQLRQLRDYLVAFHRALTTAVNSIDRENLSPAVAQAISSAGGAVTKEALDRQAATLKSLIIKSADVVYQEMDRITAELESKYVAISDSFGTFTENVNSTLTATASEIRQAIRYYGELQSALAATAGDLQSYIIETRGYIRQGIVDYDGAAPVIGIAIGQDIQTSGTDVGADGRTYDVIEKKSFLSILTAEKLSFYQGENEVAYLSNNQLYITAAHILDRIEMGDGWQLGSENGFTVKWVGG